MVSTDITIINQTVEYNQRLIAEEIEEQPSSHEDNEDDEGDRVPEEAKEEDWEDENGVVHTEVTDVDWNAGNFVEEAGGKADGTEIEHDLP